MNVDFPENLVQFTERFVTDEACAAYLTAVRWPDGAICAACGGRKGWPTSRGTYYCAGCQHQTSLTAGTILHQSHLPLRSWFLGMWLMCTQKTGLSAKGLQRELGLGSYKTAWLMLQKLRHAMVRVGREQLTGTVEVDETYLGGQESGVGGRELVGKSLVAMAVELEGKKVGRIRLRHVPDASGQSLVGFITDTVAKGAEVPTDDWNGYNRVGEAGYRHRVTPVLGDPKRALKHFPHVHLVASLLKRWLGATHQGRVTGKHLQRYLDEYAFRFNRRRSEHVGKLFHRLVEQLVLRQAKTYLEITRTK